MRWRAGPAGGRHRKGRYLACRARSTTTLRGLGRSLNPRLPQSPCRQQLTAPPRRSAVRKHRVSIGLTDTLHFHENTLGAVNHLALTERALGTFQLVGEAGEGIEARNT